MNILHAAHVYKPGLHGGGPLISIAALTEGLANRGHRIVVITTNGDIHEDMDVPLDQPVDVQGVEVWYFRRREYLKTLLPFIPYLAKSMGYLYAPKMAGILDQIVPRMDIVHTHMPFVYPTYASAKAACHHDIPVVYHQRGVLDTNRLQFRSIKKRFYIDLFERPIMKRAARLIALTQQEVDDYKTLGIDTPCRIIPNGINADEYYSEPSELLGGHIPLAHSQRLILFLGRLHPIKGADLALEAFIKVAHQLPDVVMVMAGPDEFDLVKIFQQKVAEANLGDRIFFPGTVSGRLKLDLLARADLFVLPSFGEGFSMAILEAMAGSTPVLISPECHFSEVQTHGAGVVLQRNTSSWADQMLLMLSDAGLLFQMGQKARRLVKEQYTWDNIVSQVEDLYVEVWERKNH